MWRDIFGIVKQLFIASPKAWKDIKRERRTQNEFLNRYLHPMFGLIALSSFVGELLFSQNGNVESALKQAIIAVVAVYGSYFIASYVLNETAERFNLTKNMPMFRKFVGFSSVVIYILYLIVPFFPNFVILWLLAIYTVHLLYTGAQYFVNVDKDNLLKFTILSSAVIMFTPAAINLIFSIIIK